MCKRIQSYAGHILIACYGLACIYLYYRQSIADFNETVILYQSDLPLHIKMILKDGWYYSFTAFAYKGLYYLFGKTTLGIALFLGLCSYLSVYLSERLLCFFLKKERSLTTLIGALTLNFVMPVFIPQIGPLRYISYQSGNIWHNSTYIVMRLFATITLLKYFSLQDSYRQHISIKDWSIFCLLNIITTGIKPSFLLAFSPIMGCFLLYDLIKGTSLKQVLLFGSALLPSGIVILWQNLVLFGQDTGNGIAFQPWYTFSLHASIPKLAVVCSALFCALILVLHLRSLKERPYLFLIAMVLLGFLEALCLVEKGARSVDGNFLWGYSFCLYCWFHAALAKWHTQDSSTPIGKCIKYALAIIYGLHLYCGIYFFLELLSGTTFYMS